MAYLGKSYVLVKNENFEGFFTSLGVPPQMLEEMLKYKPTVTLTKDGDSYTLTTVSDRGALDLKFESGVEFDETISKGIVAKATITVDGNVVTHVQKHGDGHVLTYKREFNDDSLIVTHTTSKGDDKAVGYYTAV